MSLDLKNIRVVQITWLALYNYPPALFSTGKSHTPPSDPGISVVLRGYDWQWFWFNAVLEHMLKLKYTVFKCNYIIMNLKICKFNVHI